MDTKSLAKSKRAHTQHHSRSRRDNSHAKSSKPVASAKPLQSNWDRYAEEDDSGSEKPSSHSGDIVFPKSKGADYRHLIAEAQSESSNHLPSLDDVFAGELNKGVCSMLSVKGEGILAWLGDDSFIVDDKETAHPEASFLSLNLHTLAEQLEKIDLSERLFIDADLLPPELRTQVSQPSRAPEHDQMQATKSNLPVRQPTQEQTFLDSSVEIENVDEASDVMSFPDPLQTFPVPESDLKENPSKFEAATAEAQLDMLLGSFDEIEILGSPGFSSVSNISAQNIKSVATSTSSNLDDDLEDLLNQTSTSTMSNSNSLRPKTVGIDKDNFVQPSSSKLSGTKSVVLDDFDSWMDSL